jgi:F-type H+-transporting ATPase subunit b
MQRFRTRRKKVQLVILPLLIAFSLLFFYGTTMAADESHDTGHGTAQTEGAGHGEGDAGAVKDLFSRILNFTAMVVILFIVLKKSNALGLFSNRVQEIKQTMDRLKQEKQESEQKYEEIEQKLKDFEQERSAILEQARKDGEAEKERIIAEAKERARQIQDQAEKNIQHEIQAAKDRLRNEVVDLAARKAEETITRELNDEDQDRLVNDFIERVGQVN